MTTITSHGMSCGKSPLLEGGEEEVPHALVLEDALGDDQAADDGADVDGGHRDDRDAARCAGRA